MKLKQNKKFDGNRTLGWKTIEIVHIYPWAMSIPENGNDWDWAKYYISCGALCNTDGIPRTLAMVDIENAIVNGEYLIG